jgi:TPR repeat protein
MKPSLSGGITLISSEKLTPLRQQRLRENRFSQFDPDPYDEFVDVSDPDPGGPGKKACRNTKSTQGTETPKSAEPFNDGLTALRGHDYATALRLFCPLAEQGDSRAQSLVGDMYFAGEGVSRDVDEAVGWLRLAAHQGNADAQALLGFIYWNGLGGQQSSAVASYWFKIAAERGNPDAQLRLAMMYEIGDGVPQNYVFAHKWFNLAAVRYRRDASFRDQAIRKRDELGTKMTPAQIAEAQKVASEWGPKLNE